MSAGLSLVNLNVLLSQGNSSERASMPAHFAS